MRREDIRNERSGSALMLNDTRAQCLEIVRDARSQLDSLKGLKVVNAAMKLDDVRESGLKEVREARSFDMPAGLKVSVLCTDPKHPVMWWLEAWAYKRAHEYGHVIEIVHDKADLSGGDVLFLISCGQIVKKADRARYGQAFVVHASDLPKGRGWSPYIWDLIGGADGITVTLLEAEDKVDAGAIRQQIKVLIAGHCLHDEINNALFSTECGLMDYALETFPMKWSGHPQRGEATYYRKRTPADSELDPEKTLAEQFDLMRVADPDRYPAFFKLRGHTYRIRLEKAD